MINWQKPIKTGATEIDELNKKLFERFNKQAKALSKAEIVGRKVQILINEPQTQFLIAVITNIPTPNRALFHKTYNEAAQQDASGFPVDPFIGIAQQDIGREFEKRYVEALRLRYNAKITATAKQISEFDQDAQVNAK